MTGTLRKKLVAVAIAVLVVAGGTTAVAAANGGKSKTSTAATAAHRGGPSDELAAAATYLGVTVTQLQTDLQSGKTLAQVASATSGKTVDGLIAALVAVEQAEHPSASVADITQRVTDFVNGVRPAGGPGFGHGPGPELSAAATYLGVTPAQLRADLQSGKTLAQIANATSGKSAEGLIQALVAADTARITALVNGTAPSF